MNVRAIFDRAAADRCRGASEIERRLVASLLEHRRAWVGNVLHDGARRLIAGQPAMANLRRLAGVLLDNDVDGIEEALRNRFAILGQLEDLLQSHGPDLLADCDRVVTISRSSAVRAILMGASGSGWKGEVVVLDGTPAGCGPDQAVALVDAGITACSWPDGAAWTALTGSPGRTQVLVGADAVGRSRFVNVSGTRSLCELAVVHAVDVVLVADSGKDVDDDALDALLAASPVFREDGPGRQWPVFEVVPLALVVGRLDESRAGVARRPLC